MSCNEMSLSPNVTSRDVCHEVSHNEVAYNEIVDHRLNQVCKAVPRISLIYFTAVYRQHPQCLVSKVCCNKNEGKRK